MCLRQDMVGCQLVEKVPGEGVVLCCIVVRTVGRDILSFPRRRLLVAGGGMVCEVKARDHYLQELKLS